MSAKKTSGSKLQSISFAYGADLFGVVDITDIRKTFLLSEPTREKFNRAISIAVRLSEAVLEEIVDHPTALYFHHYRQVNAFLDQLALKITAVVQSSGYNAMPIPASQIIDWQKQKGHLSHKHIAVLAGLGWIGKNNLLVTPEFGSRVRLVTVLTDMPLKADKPVNGSCGKCKRCIPSCPAKAIKEKQSDFDHTACSEQLRLFRKQGYTAQFICGICVKACPGK